MLSMTFAIFHKLGGQEIVLEIIQSRVGNKPNAESLRAWRRRGEIPAKKAAILLQECNRLGIAADYPRDFIFEGVRSEQ